MKVNESLRKGKKTGRKRKGRKVPTIGRQRRKGVRIKCGVGPTGMRINKEMDEEEYVYTEELYI
jgi:hypothetical protein